MTTKLKFEFNSWDNNLEVVVYDHANLIGNISGHFNPQEKALTIGSVFVEPEFRNQGIGLKLYEELFRQAAALNLRWIASLTPSAGALRVHQKLADKYGYALKPDYFPNPFF